MPFVIKADIAGAKAKTFAFAKARTMYGGRRIKVGDEIFIFASETEGGTPASQTLRRARGLIARGIVTAVKAHAKPRGLARPVGRSLGEGRWTPRVSIEVKRTALAKRPLGRDELKAWRNVKDGSPQAELDFKFYRQATNKIGGVSEGVAGFLERCF